MKRTDWDESKSEQWRYLLRKESDKRREQTRRIFKNENEDILHQREGDNYEGEIKRNKPGKKSRKSKIIIKKDGGRKQFTNLGKEILYSALPGTPEQQQ